MGFCIGAAFSEKKFGAYISYELIARLQQLVYDTITYSKSLMVIEPLAFLLYQIYDDVTAYKNTEIMKANRSSVCGFT